MGYMTAITKRSRQRSARSTGGEFANLFDADLLALRTETEKDVTKWDNSRCDGRFRLTLWCPGNQYFRHHCLDNAIAIPTGQAAIQWIARKINEFCQALKSEGKDRDCC